jgi:hypothetical protein
VHDASLRARLSRLDLRALPVCGRVNSGPRRESRGCIGVLRMQLTPAAYRVSERWPGTGRHMAREPVPVGCHVLSSRAHGTFAGQRFRARTRHWQPTCPPRTWAAKAVSPAKAGTACTRKTETSSAPRPAPRKDAGDEALLALARQAAAEHQDQRGQPITRGGLRG